MFGPPKKKLLHWKQYSLYSVAKTGTSHVNKKKNGKELNQLCQATRNRDTGGASAWAAINLDLSSVAKRETKLTSEHLLHVQFKRCSERWSRADKASEMNRAQKRKRCLQVQRAQDF
jgi:biopolymer transport protein ExbB/TolQ